MISKVGLLFLAMNISVAFAEEVEINSDMAGNGGDVVYCTRSSDFKIKLLDFYEAEENGGTIKFGQEAASFEQKLDVLLNRIARVDSARAGRYRQLLPEILLPKNFKSGIELVDIVDSEHLYFPKDCEVKQIAIQSDDEDSSPRKFLFSKDLWDELDSTGKAGLILHELVYHEAIRYNHKNSKLVRLLVGFVADEKFDSVTKEEYFEFMNGKFRGAPFQYPNIILNFEGDNSYFENGNLQWATTSKNKDSYLISPNGEKIYLNKNSSVGFWPTGEIMYFEPRENLYFDIHGEQVLFRAYNGVQVYPNFKLQQGHPEVKRSFRMQGRDRIISKYSDISLSEKGDVIGARFENSEIFKHLGREVHVKNVKLYPSLDRIEEVGLLKDFVQYRRGMELRPIVLDINDFAFRTSATFFEDGTLKSGYFYPSVSVNILDQSIKSNYIEFYQSGNIKKLNPESDVTIKLFGQNFFFSYVGNLDFYDDESLQHFYLGSATPGNINLSAPDGTQYSVTTHVYLFKNGTIQRGTSSSPFEKIIQNKTLTFEKFFEYYENGKFASGILKLAPSAPLLNTKGEYIHLEPNQKVSFTEDGLVI